MKRPLSFTIFHVIVWVTKLIPFVLIFFFLEYIKTRLDFYRGLGLRDIRDYLYVYMGFAVLTFITTFFLYARKKKALQVYYFLKTCELHCLIMALPTLAYGWQRALHIQNGFSFQLSVWVFVISLTLIFPLIYHSFQKEMK